MDNQSIINIVTKSLDQVMIELTKHGVEIDYKFDVSYTGINLQASIKDNISKGREDLLNTSLSQRVGFTQNIIGMLFNKFDGDLCQVTAIAPKNRVYPIIAKNLKNGKSYKFTIKSVKRSLGGDKCINRYSNLEKLTKDDE